MRKIPFAGIELTSQRVRGLRGTSELPGRPVHTYIIRVLLVVIPKNYFFGYFVHGGQSHCCGKEGIEEDT